MIDQICGHIHNWFTRDEDIHAGRYIIAGGSLVLLFLLEGQYFRIVGSALNDGVYRYPVEAQTLADETFDGEIWAMRPPKRFLALADEIGAWEAKYGAAVMSPYQSENVVGVYSYARAASTGGGGAAGTGWESAFRGRLNEWRRLR